MPVRNPRQLRQNNLRSILRTLLRLGPLSRKDLSQMTGLTAASLTRLTQWLLERNIIVESEIDDRRLGTGRAPTLLQVNSDAHFAVGAVVAPTFVKLALIDLTGTTVEMETTTIDYDADPRTVVDYIERFSAAAQATVANSGGRLEGVGIASSGLIDSASGLITSFPTLGWRKVDLATPLREKIAIPVLVENNVNMMAMAEQLFGHAIESERLVYIHHGRGLGCGMILPNVGLLRGSKYGGGELGHCTIAPNGPICSCGKPGCLEQLISEEYLLSKYRNARRNRRQNTRGAASLPDLVDAAANGCPDASYVCREAAEFLAMGIAILVNLIEPERIVLCGSPLLISPLTSKWIQTAVHRFCFAKDLGFSFSLSTFGEQQTVVGAAAAVFHHTIL